MKHFFALMMVAFILPQVALAQYEDAEFTDPNQTIIDSLLNAIKPDSPDSVKAYNYNRLSHIASSIDTSLKYAKLSLEFCEKSDIQTIADDYVGIGLYYYISCEPRKALPYFFKSIDFYNQLSDKQHIGNVCMNIGNCYRDINHATDSVLYYYNIALKNYNEIKDTNCICYAYRHFGDIFSMLDFNTSAEEYYHKALHYATLSKDTLEQAFAWYGLGYAIIQESDTLILSAIDMYKRSVSLFDSKETDDIYYIDGKYEVYTNLAKAYIKEAKFTGRKEYADSCYMYLKKIGNYFLENGEISAHFPVVYYYVDYLVFNKKYDAALAELLGLGKYLRDDFPAGDLLDYHEKLYETYLLLGDYKNALKHHEKLLEYSTKSLNDSTFNTLKNAEVENVRKMELLKRESAEKIHTAERQRMRTVIFSLIGGLFLISLLVFYIFRVLRIKKKANAELLEKNAILIEQKEEIQAQRDEIEEQKEEIEAQRDEIMAQRDHIEAQSKEIQSSINYARRIQRSMLTPAETISGIFPDYFLLYKPRDIVSGDYYWVGQFGDNKVCIVADCTGHGVPGGFLSVLGMSNLNYIVGQDVSPDTILNRLREAIITNLRQSDNSPSALQEEEESSSAFFRSSDGMDAAVYVINERQMKLSFAGANNPLVLIRGDEVQVLKGDRMPVGIYARLNPFQCTTIDIQRGDCLYTFSDGFQDQFESGGTFDKFSARRLRELLLEIHQRPMSEQKEILNRTYEEWRGPAENQTDDVVVMGVRI
ncbi:MAG: serine/threonine-protein phosphatase [Salinivirgaceae bacterium]|nr:serine/threonine-protein phosphatase [Salinivirgaceae bacterium]